MARRALTQELYDRLIDGFRQAPGNASHAARIAGCDRRMAARGWEQGWLNQVTWARPIREVIKGEMESARAERLRLQEQEREQQNQERQKARQDSVKAAAEEAQAAAIARANGIAVGGIIQGLLRGLIPLTRRIQDNLATEDLKPREIAKMLGDAAFIVRHGNEAIKTAFELERIRLGEPTSVIGVQSHLDDVSAEEAVEELLGIERTLRRAVNQTGSVMTHIRPDGSVVIDLPDEAYEEEEATVIELHQPERATPRGGRRQTRA